jgi:hypothetical protein
LDVLGGAGGKEGRKGTEWTPDPGNKKPRGDSTGMRGRVAYSSTVAGKGRENHQEHEESAEQQVAQSPE